ncbi:MAG: nucleotidyl transferase AbiEii/AbiGii toxin family protein [Polyangiales bacterium]
MQFPRDLGEMLSAFAKEGVRYLVIGGHAVGVHAKPRSTKDLDVWIDVAPRNVTRVCTALESFGVPKSILEDLRTARPDEIVWMGRAPARVDFLFTILGAEFSDAWKRRVIVTIEGIAINVIGREDLLANKRATARPQDLRDAVAIERAGRKTDKTPLRKPRKI